MKRRIYGIVKILALICLCAALVAPTLSSCGRGPDQSAATGEGASIETGVQSGEDAESVSETLPEDIPGGVGAPRGSRAASGELLIEYDEDEECYMVKGVGTCIDLEITIPSEYDGHPVAGVSPDAFRDAGWITRVNVQEGISVIFDNAFSGCNSLAVVSLPSTMISVYPDAFADCESLHTVYYNGEKADWQDVYTPIGEFDSLAGAMIILPTGEALNASEGLEFEVNNDGTCSLHGIGTCTDSVIRIPPVYEGRIVTSIDRGAFSFDDWWKSDSAAHRITRVDIPEGVINIENESFCYLDNLTAVSLPSTLKEVNSYMFFACDSLSTVYYNGFAGRIRSNSYGTFFEDVTLITPCLGSKGLDIDYERDFCNIGGAGHCFEDVVIAIPADFNGYRVNDIEPDAFKGLSDLLRVVIYEEEESLDGLMSIYESAFEDCVNLTVIMLPSTLSKIEKDAFAGCTSLTTVYYNGSEADWQKIEIGSGNECLTCATIIFGE